MVTEFRLPDLGEGLTEAEIVEWVVKEGSVVKEHDTILKVETAKAIVEVPSPVSGVILKIYRKQGETVKVGEVLVAIGKKGEKAPAAPAPQKVTEKLGVVGKLETSAQVWQPPIAAKASAAYTKVLATPAVRSLAKKLGVNIETLNGTGPSGRVTEDDVVAATKGNVLAKEMPRESTPPVSAVKSVRKYDFYGYIEREPLKGIRKATAEHMELAHNTVPVTSMDEVDVTFLFEFREKEKIKGQKKKAHITFLPYIIKACLDALKEHPRFNAAFDDSAREFIIKKYWNFGIAVDTPDGLIVPVIKGVEQKSIINLAKEIELIADKAAKRTLDLAELKGSTFTITNIGVLGGKFATPVVNYPDTAILLTGRIYDAPVVRDGKIKLRKLLPLSLTFDHRVNDGANAQRFMNKLKSLLEDEKWIKKWQI